MSEKILQLRYIDSLRASTGIPEAIFAMSSLRRMPFERHESIESSPPAQSHDLGNARPASSKNLPLALALFAVCDDKYDLRDHTYFGMIGLLEIC